MVRAMTFTDAGRSSMQAIQVTSFGGPEVLTPVSLPAPVPGPGEAAIAVSVADVLFLDAMIRSGRYAEAFPLRPPYIPGNGVAGRVVSTGAGVDPGWAGRLAVARAGKNHVFHARAAQRLGRLFAQHPRDGVGDVRFSAAVRPDNGGDAVPVELQFRAVTERFEAKYLELLQFEQRALLCCRTHTAPRVPHPNVVLFATLGWGFSQTLFPRSVSDASGAGRMTLGLLFTNQFPPLHAPQNPTPGLERARHRLKLM